ncbi:MAG: aldo/keto reductase [Acidobacteria bacterium]|nr:aldo/keto reductase [Acidobacteriota bacterium]
MSDPLKAATVAGTREYGARFAQYEAAGFYRKAQGLTVSSLGLGSYLGDMTDVADAAYTAAAAAALDGGINFIDTSLNYRQQRSERAIGAALAGRRREEIVLCTKAGFLVPDAMPNHLHGHDVVARMHCMTPGFLEDQLGRSLANLGVSCIDVFYLHNPETQLRFLAPDDFDKRCRAAFEKLEALAAQGRIQYYGMATWDGFRQNGNPGSLSLYRLAALAREVGGDGHRFRFIQLPFNMGMPQAYAQRAETKGGERMSVLRAALDLGITAIASATLLQTKLIGNQPEALVEYFGMDDDACRAIQFTRSAPGITTALVGMGKAEHVAANLRLAGQRPMERERFAALYGE